MRVSTCHSHFILRCDLAHYIPVSTRVVTTHNYVVCVAQQPVEEQQEDEKEDDDDVAMPAVSDAVAKGKKAKKPPPKKPPPIRGKPVRRGKQLKSPNGMSEVAPQFKVPMSEQKLVRGFSFISCELT